MGKYFHTSLDSFGIFRVVFDLPDSKVNTLSYPVLLELEEILEKAKNNTGIKLLIIQSAKEEGFIAGVDLYSIAPLLESPDSDEKVKELLMEGHSTFNKLQNMPFKTLCLIHGACLGGGLELALCCSYRLATDSSATILGLPEVSLGIYPAWGGSQRLVRRVGLAAGLPLILGGRLIDAKKALKIHLVDGVIAHEFLEEGVNSFIDKILSNKISPYKHSNLLQDNPLWRSICFCKAKQEILKKTKGRYLAPLILLKLIKETYSLPLEEGLQVEINTFLQEKNKALSKSRHLIRLFFTQDTLKKAYKEIPTAVIQSAALIGAGTMGSLIAYVLSLKGIDVRIKDVDWPSLTRGFKTIFHAYQSQIKRKKMTYGKALQLYQKISGTIDYSGFKHADLVIEAAIEEINLKREILAQVESVVSKDALIATNTSSLTLAEIGIDLKHPERFLGLHFFNPPDKMPLVEVVTSDKTSLDKIAQAVHLCQRLGKVPIVVKDCPGFLVNRILLSGMNEALRMYEEGISFTAIEEVMQVFGMPMSPFVLADEVGLDVCYKACKILEEAYGERMKMPKLLHDMYQEKLFGKKVGAGFFTYQEKDKRKFNPKVQTLVKPAVSGMQLAKEVICDRLFLSMINEAVRCLEEKVVENAPLLDMALILGIGFPPYRGGLLRYADDLGVDYVVRRLKAFTNDFGKRFTPCQLLLTMEAEKNFSGKRFY